MKYFGKKSLSSALGVVLHVSWYAVLIFSIFLVMFLAASVFSTSLQDIVTSEIAKGGSTIFTDSCKDAREWHEFQNAPLVAKVFVFPYLGAVTVLLLQIIRKSRHLFDNFKKEIVFNNSNVLIISTINKMTIAFSIITFNFSGLLTCVLLIMLGKILENGAVLQEEHDLTV